MTPIDIQSKLAIAFPSYRWLVDPIATNPTVGATQGDRYCKVTLIDNFHIEIADSKELDRTGSPRLYCNWIDRRSLDEILPILGKHLEWFMPQPRSGVDVEKAIARPRATA